MIGDTELVAVETALILAESGKREFTLSAGTARAMLDEIKRLRDLEENGEFDMDCDCESVCNICDRGVGKCECCKCSCESCLKCKEQ